MVNKGAIRFALMLIIGFGLFIYTPIALLSVNLSTYDTIDEFNTYPYYSENSSEIQKLNLNIEVGNVEVKYIAPPVDYLVKVDVNVELSGSILAGKSYEDFFNITLKLENINSTLDFTLEIISNDWFNPSLWSLQNVSIVVNIRKNVIIDIITVLDDGDLEITVPYGVSIGNLIANVSNGDILYDLESCTIEGNITGITNKGDLELKAYNVKYTQNSNWMLNSTGGVMGIEIHQYKEMGANITGIAWITNGGLGLLYNDTTANIGAVFAFPVFQGLVLPQVGFNIIFQGIRLSFISFDFPTINNYNLSLYLTNSGCGVELHSD